MPLFEGSAIHSPEPPKPAKKRKPKPTVHATSWTGKPQPAPKKKPKPSQKGKPKKVKAASLAALDANRPVDVILSQPCYINGRMYGPGRVRVPGPMARTLMDLDRYATEAERNFDPGHKRAFIIGARGARREIPYDSFDYHYGNAAPVPLSHF